MKKRVVTEDLPYTTAPYQLLTTDKAAALFGVEPLTLSRWARQGLVPFLRLPSGQMRFSRVWCEAYMKANSVNVAEDDDE